LLTQLVNKLLAETGLAADAEAQALGMDAGLNPHLLFDVIRACSGASWSVQDRMACVLQNDFEPRVFVHILARDMACPLQWPIHPPASPR
jgi:putative dehydrogenase